MSSLNNNNTTIARIDRDEPIKTGTKSGFILFEKIINFV